MRFPFLAAEYTNICAFATFSKSSAVELLTGQKFCGPAGGLRAPVWGAARSWLPCPPPSRRTPRLCGSRFPGLSAARPSGPCRHARCLSGGSPATPVAGAGMCTHSHILQTLRVGSVRQPGLSAELPLPCGCKMWVRTHTIGLQDMYPVARGADRACTPHPVRLESDRRETRLRAALRSPIGAAYELVS